MYVKCRVYKFCILQIMLFLDIISMNELFYRYENKFTIAS